MGLIYRLRRWVKLGFGTGKSMREAGATVSPCPHCGRETPVYRSEYNRSGDPVSFSVCVWCRGFIEWSSGAAASHEPYASADEIQAHR